MLRKLSFVLAIALLAFSAALLALIGMRGAAMQGRQAIPDETLIFYAGHFAHRLRSADALRQMLSEIFDRPVGISQFQGHWANLLTSEQTQIGGRPGDSRRYATLTARRTSAASSGEVGLM